MEEIWFFFLFLSNFFPIQFKSPALDLNRWARSIELNGQKLIVMLNWLVVNSFWYLMHSGTPIERWIYFVIARSHGFVRNPKTHKNNNKTENKGLNQGKNPFKRQCSSLFCLFSLRISEIYSTNSLRISAERKYGLWFTPLKY